MVAVVDRSDAVGSAETTHCRFRASPRDRVRHFGEILAASARARTSPGLSCARTAETPDEIVFRRAGLGASVRPDHCH